MSGIKNLETTMLGHHAGEMVSAFIRLLACICETRYGGLLQEVTRETDAPAYYHYSTVTMI